VGVLLDRAERTVRFFLNGQDLGPAFTGVSEERLYPMVGMRTRGESVRVNFGADSQRRPFRGVSDFWALRAAFVARAALSVASTPLPGEDAADALLAAGGGAGGVAAGGQQEQGQAANGGGGAASAADAAAASPAASSPPTALPAMPLMPSLVFQYLMHHRCWRTASILAREIMGGGGGGGGGGAAGNGNGNGGGGGAAPMDVGDDTAAATAAAADVPEALRADVEDAVAREEVCAAIKAGDIPSALQAAARALRKAGVGGGGATENNGGASSQQQQAGASDADAALIVASALGPHLLFRLRVQQFLEAVRRGDVDGALSFARTQLGPAADASADAASGRAPSQQNQQQQAQHLGGGVFATEAAMQRLQGQQQHGYSSAEAAGGNAALLRARAREDGELLQDALSLLAYEDPAASPCAHLLKVSAREQLAERVNGALVLARRQRLQLAGGLLLASAAAPAREEPAVERLYRHATAALDELKRMADPRAMVLDADQVLRVGLMELARPASASGGGGGEAAAGKVAAAAPGGDGGGGGGASGPAAAANRGGPSLMEIV
jgi:hypothetical protein